MMDKGHFRFGVFEVDVHRGELWKDGSRIKLQDKPLQLLVLLLERAGETATRDELGRELWPENTFAHCDASLKTAVSKLRQALGDSANRPAFIKTVHLRGYRFIAPIVRLDQGNPCLDVGQMPAVLTSANPSGSATDAIGVTRLIWAGRLLAVLLAVAMIVTLAYVFRRNSMRVSRSSTQPAVRLILTFGSFSGSSKQGNFNR